MNVAKTYKEYKPHYPEHEKRRERYEIEKLREHSKEDQPNKVTFLVLDDYKLGFEVDWIDETLMFFLYKDKKREEFMKSSRISWWAGAVPIKMILTDLVIRYYKKIGHKPEIPMYADIELAILCQHFHYLVWSGQLEKGLAKEIIYSY